ncbi:MAG: hypothetical protein JWO92_897 [Chitinophagaceae bacterium]|nr:hypothetical protein [Chitinophagaceae bacterium]
MLFYLDGHNIGQWKESGYISLSTILTLIRQLEKRGNKYVCYFDADIQFKLRNQNEEHFFLQFIKNNKNFKLAPGGAQADGFIIMDAQNNNASIISNDAYKHSLDEYPWLRKGYTPQRLFKGAVNPNIHNQDMLMIPDLQINVPIQNDIETLIDELDFASKTFTVINTLSKLPVKEADILSSSILYKSESEIDNSKAKNPDDVKKDSSLGQSVAILFIVALIFGISYFTTRMESPTNQQDPKIPANTKSVEKTESLPQIPVCETKNTGDYSFVNKTDRKIYLFLRSDVYSKAIEIDPHETATEYDMQAGEYFNKYDYTCTYFKKGDYRNSDIRGQIIVEKCKTTTLELTLPVAYWYDLIYDEWKEIKIPDQSKYAIVMPYKNFTIKYEDDETEHYGYSYGFIPEGVSKFFVKYDFTQEDAVVSLHKLPPLKY